MDNTNKTKLIKVLKAFKVLHPEATVSQLLFFLMIRPDGVTHTSEAITAAALQKGAVSRIVDVLTTRGRGKTPGLGLIEDREDPADRRYKIILMTPKGLEFYKQIDNTLSKGRES